MQVVITLVLTLSQHHGNEMIKWHPSGAWRRPFFPTCAYTAVSRPTQLLGEWSCAAYAAPKVIYGCVCSRCCFVKNSREIDLSAEKVNARLSDRSYGWHSNHLFMTPVLTKTSTLPTQEVCQGQAVGPAVALAAACMHEARQRVFWLPYQRNKSKDK